MSNVTTAFDNLATRIQTILPNHVRLTNPYSLDQNSEQFLDQGWGLGFGSDSNSNRLQSCQLSLTQSFIVPITRKYFATEFGVENKATMEKNLMEDRFLLIKDLEKDTTLNGGDINVRYIGSSGIQTVFSGRDVFLSIVLQFDVEIFEDLN